MSVQSSSVEGVAGGSLIKMPTDVSSHNFNRPHIKGIDDAEETASVDRKLSIEHYWKYVYGHCSFELQLLECL
ncbi:hypothetical protein TNCV_3437751 [Trichonephila clavipes]|nr:hypothetical protein TNCV_3437751 [Trichonephila clavipes]